MKALYILPLVGLLVALTCSRQEKSVPAAPPFNNATFSKRVQASFFSDSAKGSLRLLRNEIYARHGRIFESPDLQRHFSAQRWYRPSHSYNDAMLSKSELEAVGSIVACEAYVQKMTDADRRHYDSVKTFCRRKSFPDTVIVDHIDYTGDGKKEKCITRIFRSGDSVVIRHIIANARDTILNKTSLASFAPDKDLPMFDVYNNFATALRLSPFRASLHLISPDIKKQYGGRKELKDYVSHFRGAILFTVTSESAGCSYFWYAPEKKFEELYCE